jgi:hypothetical protein
VVSFGRALVGLLVWVSCAPPRAVDRGFLVPDAAVDVSGRAERPDPDVGEEPDAELPDAAPDVAVDASTPDLAPDAMPAPDVADTAPDQPVARTALLVVANASVPLTLGDPRLQQVLVAKGFTVRLANDEDPVNVTGVNLVVLSESCAGLMLGDKYRDVAVPVLVLERAVFFEMGMTGNNFNDHGVSAGTQVSILMEEHQMAAGLAGTVAVLNGNAADLGWGRPAAGAVRVAIMPGISEQVAIFGYARGAAMVIGQAPARRVGGFVMNRADAQLNTEGMSLLGAAIDWAVQ